MTNPRGRNTSAFSKEPARLPALPTVRVDDASMQRFVNAVAEWIEVRSGARGDKFERAITVRDLVELGVVDPASLGRGALRGRKQRGKDLDFADADAEDPGAPGDQGPDPGPGRQPAPSPGPIPWGPQGIVG